MGFRFKNGESNKQLFSVTAHITGSLLQNFNGTKAARTIKYTDNHLINKILNIKFFKKNHHNDLKNSLYR